MFDLAFEVEDFVRLSQDRLFIDFLGFGQVGEFAGLAFHLLLEALDALLGVFEGGLERGGLVVRQSDLIVVFDNEFGRKESFDHRFRGAAFADRQEKKQGGAERDERGEFVAGSARCP